MALNPLKDYVILEEIKKELSKVILTDTVDVENHQALVISVGPEVTLVQPGDKVLIKNYGFDEVEWEGKVYKVGKVDGIYAIV